MEKYTSRSKKYCGLVSLVLLTVISQSVFSQQHHDNDVYLLKKDWSATGDLKDATYFMELIPENDSTYSCRYYNKFGPMVRQETFLDSELTVPNGRFCWYDANGNLDSTGEVRRGKKDGAWNYYNDSLEPTLSIVYDNGRLIEKRNYSENVYTDATGNISNLSAKEKSERDAFVADSVASDALYKNPGFGEPDSSKQWKDYLKKNISVPERFRNVIGNGSCTAMISFTVNREGKTDDIYLTHSCEWSADNEVFNAVRKSPIWRAAERYGNRIDYSLHEAVTFHSSQTKDSAVKSVFIGVQVEAKFPGGTEVWRHFLEGKLNQHVAADNNAPIGEYTVVISFLVQKDGTVAEVNAIQDPGYGTAEEVIRVVKKSPKWVPAMQDGVPVIYRQKQSMTFSVSQY